MIPESLQHRLQSLRDRERFAPELLERFATWIATAPEEALFRVNPLDYARAQELPEREAIDLFVHAVRAGILDFAWGLICPRCRSFLRTREGLRDAGRTKICPACDVPASQALDDGIEVTFTVNAAVRPIRFHGHWSSCLDARPEIQAARVEDLLRMYASRAVQEGAGLKMFRAGAVRLAALPNGREVVLDFVLDPQRAGDWRLLVPSVHGVAKLMVDPSGPGVATIAVDEDGAGPNVSLLKPGPVQVRVVQRTASPELLAGIFCLDLRLHPPLEPIGAAPRFLTGKRLLSAQSFRDLFRTATLAPDDSLEIRALTVLFTDLKASTQLYERVGDFKALELVRHHFEVLHDVVSRREGAVVKTIGDAVMATFVEPRQAAAAAVEMHRELERASPGTLQLKIGLHLGPCVAVDSNDRLDYFGQTVNIAARVQGLAEGGEVVFTDAVARSPGVAELLKAERLALQPESARLKGIDAPVGVQRARVL